MPKPYLLRRSSGVYARFFVPTPLQPLVGSRYLLRPLYLPMGDAARLVAAQMAMALSQAFDTMRGGVNVDLEEVLRSIRENGHRDLTIKGVTLPNGVSIAEAEINTPQDEAMLLRVLEDLAKKDPLQAAMLGISPTSIARPGPLLSERITVYLGDMRRAERSAKNVLDTEHSLGLFLALGQDKPIEQVTATDVRSFLDALEVYPSNASKKKEFAGLAPADILARAKSGGYAGLSMRTKEKHRDRIAAFFNAQAAEDLIPKAPHKAILNRAKTKTDAPSREPFSAEELALLFDHDAFTAWAIKYPHRWWGTVLGFATGARVGEIGQLYTDDVAQESGQWGVHIRARRTDQRLKNAHSSRFVPLPTSVLAAGFLAFIDDVKRAGHDRVFPHLPYSDTNGYGDNLGDQFRRYAIQRGLTGRLKSFHCFRHNVANALINEHHVAIQVVQEITGHDLTLPPGLKHYVNPGTIPSRLAALEAYGPPMPLPAYTPGQFDRAFKQVRHMERRRGQAADKRKISANKN